LPFLGPERRPLDRARQCPCRLVSNSRMNASNRARGWRIIVPMTSPEAVDDKVSMRQLATQLPQRDGLGRGDTTNSAESYARGQGGCQLLLRAKTTHARPAGGLRIPPLRFSTDPNRHLSRPNDWVQSLSDQAASRRALPRCRALNGDGRCYKDFRYWMRSLFCWAVRPRAKN
jgi:hypothetical protein